ncbi:unnamed protein product [Medioppia subpectinata]|uniref:Uncharacterized protein n=1 Tax=Medioppia subpectinata TaxID=1979941 RepID=A0A7R9Q7A1_9ACAR|nr:unnamed protein product [Medioppia subpectinata]CAG2115346.1 unnamed protein product [Medioppia subpectinata]
MAGFSVARKILEKRAQEKQLKINDMVVFDEDLPHKLDECRLTFVDFAPILKRKDHGGGIQSVQYSELMDFANKWLLRQECWDVLSAETVSAIIEIVIDERGEVVGKHILSTFTVTEDSAGYEEGVSYHHLTLSKAPIHFRVKMLRLWLLPFDSNEYNEKVRPIVPQIQFRDFEPCSLTDIPGEFESCDDVMARLNDAVNAEEITGKVLNVQTLACGASHEWRVDTESTEAKPWVGKTVYVLRVFYALGPIHEELSSLIRKASKWLSDNPEVNFCSASSIDVKLKSMVSIDTKQMAITRDTGDFVRILRLVYTKPRELPSDIPISSTLPPPPPVYIGHRTFVVHKGYGDVKRVISEFLARDEWRATNQYKWLLVNVETVAVFASNGLRQPLETNADQSFQALLSSNLSMNRTEYFAIKLYYDVGYYGIDHLATGAKAEEEAEAAKGTGKG